MDVKMKAVPAKDRAEEGILWYINNRGLVAGDRLPAERELGVELNVSRTALRSAIATLISNGILESRHGSGTYVRPPKPLNIFQDSYGFSEVVRASGLTPSSRLVSSALIAASDTIASRLGLNSGASLFELQRVRLADGQPVMIETAYVNCALCPGIEAFDFEARALYDVLAREYDLHIEHGEERITITRLTDEEAGLLDSSPGSPVFFESALEMDANRNPVEYVKSVILPNRFRFASNGDDGDTPLLVEVDDAWLRS